MSPMPAPRKLFCSAFNYYLEYSVVYNIMKLRTYKPDNFAKSLENIRLIDVPNKFSKVNRNFERVFEKLTLHKMQEKLTQKVKYNFFNKEEINLLGVTSIESH